MNDAIYEDFINRLRSESDIVSIILEYVSLKRKGKKYWGCCPFHNEKTPSFSVTPEKGLFYCFGCQTGGDIFSFLMQIENIAFKTAVKLLAERANIEIPQAEKTENERLKEKELNRLYEINELAKDFFYVCLKKTNFGQSARDYLLSRGIDDEMIEKFKLGFAPPAWDKLCSAFQERGIAEDKLLKTGLVVLKSSGEGVYDRFRNRIMLPIHDGRGRIAGFGGRVLDNSHPKYLNSPETLIFNKRHMLFAFNHAVKMIKDSGQAVVVEGYLDAIAAHAYGFANTVASLGTAFTPEQTKMLMRLNAEIIFAYDSDAAGKKATIRALQTVNQLGGAGRVVSLPSGKDPDEFLRKNGDKAFKAIIYNSLAFLDYQIKVILDEVDYSTVEGKIKAIGTIIPILASVDNAVAVNVNVKKLSQILSIEEAAINIELNKHYKKNSQKQKDKNVRVGKATNNITVSAKNRPSAVKSAEQHIIRLMCEEPALIPYVSVQLTYEDFFDEGHRKIINSIFCAYNMKKSVIPECLFRELGEEAKNAFAGILLMDIRFDDITRLVDDCIKTIKLARLKEQYEKHRLRADELERLGDCNYIQELAESMRIYGEIQKLQK